MKKQIFASALALACAAACAQSNVTIYGVIDQSISVEKNGAGTVRKMEPGVMNGSRLGFRGAEDLGGGLSAVFTLEMGINSDDGSLAQGGLAFGRQSFVGLTSTQLGSVKLGRQYSPVYMSQLNVDPFIGGMKGDMTGTRGWFNSGNFRVNNATTYASPNWNGLQLNALYGFGEVANNSGASRQFGWSADYLKGPVTASVAYHSTNNATATDNQHVTFVGGAYDFGVVKIHGAYDDLRGTANAKVRDFMLGLSAPAGPGKLIASVLKKDNRAVADAEARQVSVGYLYLLSKRTALYTSLAFVHNDRNSAIASGGVNGATDKVLDIGIRHAF